MRISEIFYSVQGEGSLTGVPSVFVRTSGCNLRCTWCDTPYASWKPEGPEMALDQIEAEVYRHPARHVVVTGGEPMIARDISLLLGRFHQKGLHITVETAGTVAPDSGVMVDLASISPKLRNSTPTVEKAGEAWVRRHEETRFQPQVIRNWMERAGDYQIKFVISSAEDLAEAELLLARLECMVPPEKVLLMPEGTSLEVMRSRYSLLVGACLERGYRLSPRLHIELFGNKRGT